MKYKVLERFREKNHDDLIYEANGIYPAEGYKATKARVEELTTKKNKYNRPFLEEIKSKKSKE
ncbi:hypothetical protein QT711_03375 [Sporosarcina saromensis]|uniref:Phage protein n=1 Tax=Sporosarcina saromensis TaxID=359365 RepID=A0ABU4G5N0_9BACL|nr:hypothetical protein [Sporosarcina saromensis]MDW0112211.1 hypothetical protein [Sporosarcina saromensis]